MCFSFLLLLLLLCSFVFFLFFKLTRVLMGVFSFLYWVSNVFLFFFCFPIFSYFIFMSSSSSSSTRYDASMIGFWVFHFFGFTTWNLFFLNLISCKLDVQYYHNLINFKFPWVNIKLCTSVQEKWARSQCSLCCSLKQGNHYPNFFFADSKRW
jgi:hypothetical protein